MSGTAARHLYLVRHAEAVPDETELTERGRRQAVLLGQRLRAVPLAAIHHGPLPRAEQTAHLAAAQFGSVPCASAAAAGDYPPQVPAPEELPAEAAADWSAFLAGFSEEEALRGAELAAEAVARFTGPVPGAEPRHELLVTHNFLAGWLVRDAFRAPGWRWLGLQQPNAALTVIRYTPDRPPAVLLLNDLAHLPPALWTDVLPGARV